MREINFQYMEIKCKILIIKIIIKLCWDEVFGITLKKRWKYKGIMSEIHVGNACEIHGHAFEKLMLKFCWKCIKIYRNYVGSILEVCGK